MADETATAQIALTDEYEAHARAKEARVHALLAEHGLDGLFRGMRRCPVERGWRMQASFYLIGGSLLGVDPRRGRAPAEQVLWTLPEHARPLAAGIAERIASAGVRGVTGFDLRLEYGSDRAHLILAVERGTGTDPAPLCDGLRSAFPALLGVAVPSRGIELGEAYLRHEVLGKSVLAHHRAFFQTNRWLTPALAAAAGEAAADDPSSLVDLYCGVGLHSVLAATAESRVFGADTNRWAIDSARRNAALHGLAHARYEELPVERLRSVEEGALGSPSIVFVNPSRFGCAPGVAEAVARWRPGAVCLVSCSIDSHVRDVLDFRRAGYRPLPFGSFDMFPFSGFLESVTVFHPGR